MKREHRLTKNKDFQRILEGSVSVSGSSFILYGSKSKEGKTRVGITVSKKLGPAVVRNRVKRQVRMMLEAIVAFDKAIDIVILLRRDYMNRNYAANMQQLTTLYHRMIERV